MRNQLITSSSWIALTATLISFLAGCATEPKTTRTEVFYPPPPNEPRLQFLTGFSSEKDLHGGQEKSLMTYLTGAKPSEKSLGKPYGGAAHDKKLYLCDTALGAVLVVDLANRQIGVLDAQGEGALRLPLNICVDADGTCYVTDTGREQVVIFDKNGVYTGSIGKPGEMKPRDVAVTQDRIYVADLQKRTVHVLQKGTRDLLFDIPREEDRTNQTHALFTPTNLALDSKGRIYVSDTGAYHIQVYDSDGKYVRSVGEMGDGQGQFARVKGIAVDHEDRLYAVDAMSKVVQIFDEKGSLLTWFGEPGTGGVMNNLPAKVLVDYDDLEFFRSFVAPSFQVEHLVFVVNQIGANKVSVYGFGRKK